MKTSYHHGDLFNALLDAAENALREQGLEQLSIRDLAKQIGVSHAAPARHFASKQALLAALSIRGFQRLRERLHEICDQDEVVSLHTLENLLHGYVTFALENSELYKLMYQHIINLEYPEVMTEVHATSETFVEIIAYLQSAGELREANPDVMAIYWWTHAHGLASILAENKLIQPFGSVLPSTEMLVDAQFQFMLEGIMAR
ncbi:MAG: TetR/AcrR family transcriptional regulator [Anaerolineae bacterium]